MMKMEFLKLNRKPANPNKVPERSSKRSLPALSLVEVSLSKGRTAKVCQSKGVSIGILAAFLLAACSDIGERNNIHDYDGDNFAFGDDLYYLNRDGGGFDGEIRQGQVTGELYIFDNEWRIASDLEKDTYDYSKNEPWGAGEIGEIRAGTFSVIFDPSTNTKSSIYYIFDGSWRQATDFERDTYNYEENKPWATGKNGEIRAGVISSTLYIFDGSWRIATDTEKDTYKQECSEFGQIIHGSVNTDYAYFCYGNEWKRFYGNETVSYGKLVDERDGRIYRTVKIGEQTWIAENLNYADSINYPSMLNRNWCYNNNLDSCEKYGRHYTWSATIDSVYWKKKGKNCGFKEQTCDLPNQVRGICPTGWHIPSSNEWETLYSSMGASHKAMQAKNFPEWTKAIDEYGFSALPVGYYSGSFQGVGSRVYFWSATEHSTNYAYYWYLGESNALLGEGNNAFGFSVRCIKDEE